MNWLRPQFLCRRNVIRVLGCNSMPHWPAPAPLGNSTRLNRNGALIAHILVDLDINRLEALNWTAIRATQSQGLTHEKSAEFLVADFFEWSAIVAIGCHNDAVKLQIEALLAKYLHRPQVTVQPNWYY